MTREINLKNKNAPIHELRVEALGGVSPLTNFIISTTAIAKSKLNKKRRQNQLTSDWLREPDLNRRPSGYECQI